MGMRRHGAGAMARLALDMKKATRPIGQLLKGLTAYLKGFIGLLVFAAIISMIYSATQIINPLILSRGIDEVAAGQVTTRLILIYGGIFLALAGIGFILNSFSTRLLSRVRAYMVNDIRLDVYQRLINSSMGYLKTEQSGNVTARITSDTDEIATGIQIFISVATQLLLLVATLVILILETSWQITLICLGSIPIALIASAVLSNVGRRIIVRIRRAFGIVSGKMAENLSGVAVSKSFNREESLSNQMRVLNKQHYDMNKQFGLMMNVMMPLISMVASITIACILLVGGVIDMSAGEIFLGTVLANRFLRPLIMLSMAFPQLQSSLGAMDRIMDVMEAAPAITNSPAAKPLEENYSVSFENIWFAYNEGTWVIKDISFDVKEGEMVALVGHTGAGKTTIASMLLPRFYDIQKGSIKVGNQDLREVTQRSLRQALGLIPQEPYLFTSTVLENIRYGKPEATEEEIYEICQLIGAEAFIEALPEGYNTVIQEGGKKLSAGQRQIITIARAMLADPKILILDEATNRLDAYSESLVQAAQEKLFKDRTTFVIAHRLSTIHNADKIVVFEEGELVEMGSHEELMKLDGVYADLYKTYYAFQGLETPDIEAIVEEEEEVELSPMAMMAQGKFDPEKIKKLVAEGKITPAMMAQMKKMRQLAEKVEDTSAGSGSK